MNDLINEFYKAIEFYEKINTDIPQHTLLNIKQVKEVLKTLEFTDVAGDAILVLDTTGFKLFKVNNYENPPHPMSFFQPYKKDYLQLCYVLETSFLPIEQWCSENKLAVPEDIETQISSYRQGKYIDGKFFMPSLLTLPDSTTYCRYIYDNAFTALGEYFPDVKDCNEVTFEATSNDDEVIVRFNNKIHYREDMALYRYTITRNIYNELINLLTISSAATLETLDSIVVFRYGTASSYETNYKIILTDDWKRSLITQIID